MAMFAPYDPWVPNIRCAYSGITALPSAQVAGVVGGFAGGARLEGGAHLGGNLALLPGLGIDVHVGRLAGHERVGLPGTAYFEAQDEGRRAEPLGGHGQ